MLYFLKELGDEGRPLTIRHEDGRIERLAFDFLAIEDSDPRAKHLLNASIRKLAGVVVITQERYEEELKKKASAPPLNRRSREEIKPRSLPYSRRQSVSAVGENRPVAAPSVTQTPAQAAIVQDFSAFRPTVQKGVVS